MSARMNGYPSYPQQTNAGMVDMNGAAMDAFTMDHVRSLDDIVSSNDKANRRRSMPVYGGNQMGTVGSPDARRFSSMNFGRSANPQMDDFQFDMPAAASFPRTTAELQNDRIPATDLAINTQFSGPNPTSPFNNVANRGSAYPSPLQHNGSLDMDISPYPHSMPIQLDMNNPMAMMPNDMNMFPNAAFSPAMMDSPVAQDFAGSQTSTPQDNNNNTMTMPPVDTYRNESSNATPNAPISMPTRTGSQDQNNMRSAARPQDESRSSSRNTATQMSNISLKNQEPVALPPGHNIPPERYKEATYAKNNLPWNTPVGPFPSTLDRNPHSNTQFKNAYSSTGFDMLGVLMRVATRPNPQIDIGSVDLSCAFVVCDAAMDDMPIVYCSENFERLTGYSKHMILGRNCRFLQSPDGKVEPGVKRTYVDDNSVLYLKNTIADCAEAQISLINYRRGGQPFMNLLTMIPIAWEPGGKTKFFVGFQVDLVEQPHSMTNKNPDGSYRVNYQRGMSMPSYVFTDHKAPHEQGTTISKDEVSNVLAAYGSTGDSEITRRLWDKVLLENTDDVVHVLSLKGLFLYLSPSSHAILEYDPSELIGTALSSVCHPSDIVPVTRELKETSNSASVNVVFRIRRKKSGYMWFEGHGSLHTEQGKGRKCIILVGRERPVYTLSKTALRASGGIGDNEIWSKMSTSGMFLFIGSNVRSLLDKQPEDLVGTSIQALMRPESKQQFGKILELARSGRKGDVKHEVINKRGQVLQAFTTIYPGDATAGHKPTFLVGQTRLLKYQRNASGQRPSLYQSRMRNSDESQISRVSANTVMSQQSGPASGSATSHTTGTDPRFATTEEQAATFSGSSGLQIGHQDQSLASEDNVFDELKTTRSTSWQYELRQMEKRNRYLAEEVQSLLAAKKKRKRRKGAGQMQKDCANCHTRTTPEWRRGPSGNRDLCNSCGLRWAKQQGRMSPRTSSAHSVSDKSKKSVSPRHTQTFLPNVIQETGQQSSVPSTLAQPAKGSQSDIKHDPHAAKVARLEVAASQGYNAGTAVDIPPKIDEGIEPD